VTHRRNGCVRDPLQSPVSQLFKPLTLRGTSFRNRAWVAAMCQYSSTDGLPSDWHLVHLGGLATGGAGLVLTEATAVTAEGRISSYDAGLWNDDQLTAYQRITAFIRGQGAVPGIQLAHAGRKASTRRPGEGGGTVGLGDGGWLAVAPSPLAYAGYATPREMSVEDIAVTVRAFADAARRADAAGFEVVELHAAHGYLIHEFLSPLSNHRRDGYGGDFTGRTRFLLEVAEAVRDAWPAEKPLFIRFSATDWVDGGWTTEETVEAAKLVGVLGVDLVDISSGGLSADQQVPVGPGYQVPLARLVREGSGLPVAAVGLITEPQQAEQVLVDGSADAVLLARALLRDPHWPLRAARELGDDVEWPVQYARAKL
jgi:2,4-dienoyl-CoA reductase-like NADH-dependent reductase (Old Yellow Enzyme family)